MLFIYCWETFKKYVILEKKMRKQFGFEGCDEMLLDTILNDFEFLIV
jgi:hypothetical protein